MSAAKNKSAPPKPRLRWRFWLALVALLVLAAVCLFKIKLPSAFNTVSAATFTLEPQEKKFAAYAGSVSCESCHAEEFLAWADSHHRHAERLPDATDEKAFTPRTFLHGTQKTSMRETNGYYKMISAGLHGTNETFLVQRILAENPLCQMLVAFPGGRWQATEVAFDPRSNEWFNVFGAENRQPGEWGHWTGRGMNWNSLCATCCPDLTFSGHLMC